MKQKNYTDKTFMRHLIAILDHNLADEHFGVSELAEAANISRSHLHRKVHAYNGNSTSQFIREYRLNKAKEMLQRNGQTVAEVAYSVGFSSPTYFNTCFKDLYGYSPGEAKFHESETGLGDRFRNRILLFSLSFLTLTLIGLGIYYWLPDKKLENEVAITEITETSIAVLPLYNWSGDVELDYISDGMTDAIINRLTQIASINKVVPFRSVVAYKNTSKSVLVIAEELGVKSVLQGNIQHSGEVIRISLQLLDGKTDSHIWSHEYSATWPSTQMFEIQSNVAENVANYLDVELTNEEYQAIKEIPTQNTEAYNNWLKANYQDFKGTQEGMQNAIPLYKEAIHLDSTFLDPYVDLAQLYIRAGGSWGLFSEEEAWNKTKNLLLIAREIDSTHQEATRVLNTGLYLYEWDFNNMEKNYSKNVPFGMKYQYCLQTGRYEEALDIIEKVIVESCVHEKMDVEWCALMNTSKVGALNLLNRTEEALEILKSNEKLLSENFMFLKMASEIYFYMGEFERSYALLSKIMERYPDNNPPTLLWEIAACEYIRGNPQKAREYIADLENRYHDGASGSPAWFTALYYASIEDYEKAIEWLQNSYDRHEVEMIWLRTIPVLKPLRDDPRYLELYHKVGFPVPPLSE